MFRADVWCQWTWTCSWWDVDGGDLAILSSYVPYGGCAQERREVVSRPRVTDGDVGRHQWREENVFDQTEVIFAFDEVELDFALCEEQRISTTAFTLRKVKAFPRAGDVYVPEQFLR